MVVQILACIYLKPEFHKIKSAAIAIAALYTEI